MLDGRIARMTGTTSAFGIEFDSLADVISFGVAPAILSFSWGLQPLGRLGWAAGFLFVAAAARAAGALQHPVGLAGQAVLRRHAEPGRGSVFRRRPCSRIRRAFRRYAEALPVLAMVHRPGAADGQHDPLPQLQDLRSADAPQLSGAAAGRRSASRCSPRSRSSCWSCWPTRYLASAFIELALASRLHGVDRPPRAQRARTAKDATAGLVSDHEGPSSSERSCRSRQRQLPRVVPRSRSLVTQSFRRSTPRCAWRSAGPGRCRSPWSRSRARTPAPALRHPCRRRCRTLEC